MAKSFPAKDIKAFILDMDGVLTDGSVLVLDNGLQARRMHVRDGYAIQLAVKKGYHIAVISGGNYTPALDRFEKLGIKDVYMGVTNKMEVLRQYLEQIGIAPEETVFMGDDMPDLDAMQQVGYPVCPADAVEEIKSIAVYISPVSGGEGCVRDVIEKVLKLQDNWQEQGIASR